MPWSCPSCDAEANDRLSVCPECGYAKSAWTVVADITRAFAITRKHFDLLRGTIQRSLAPDDPALGALELVQATYVPVIPKAKAQAIADAGQVPPPAKVLFVAFKAKRTERVDVEVLYEAQASDELQVEVPYPDPPPEGGVVHAKLLCVFGPEELAPDLFEDLTLIDVSEEGGAGFANELEFAALRQDPRSLPTRYARRRFRFSF